MTFVEAAVEVLRRGGRPMSVADLVKAATRDKLLSVIGRDPEATMQQRLDELFANGGYHDDLVRVRPGVFGLKRYPAAGPAPTSPVGSIASSMPGAPGAQPSADGEVGGGRRRRRRRGGRGKASADMGADGDDGKEESDASDGLAAAGVAGERAANGAAGPTAERQDGRPRLPELATLPKPTPVLPVAMAQTLAEDEPPPEDDPEALALVADEDADLAADAGPAAVFADRPVHEDEDRQMRPAEHLGDRKDRRDRRRGKGDRDDRKNKKDKKDKNDRQAKSDKSENLEKSDRSDRKGKKEKGAKRPDSTDRNAESRQSAASPPVSGSDSAGAAPDSAPPPSTSPPPVAQPAQAPQRPPSVPPAPHREASRPHETKPPVGPRGGDPELPPTVLRGEIGRTVQRAFDAIEAGRGRGMNVQQIAQQIGVPADAMKRLRVALLLEERWLESKTRRPRVRALGGGQYAAWGRRLDNEVVTAEESLRRAQNAVVASTTQAVARRLERLPPASFELVCTLLLERVGWVTSEIVRRTPEVVYFGLGGGPLSTVRALTAVRLGNSPIDRRAVGELRAGLPVKGFDLGLLLSIGKLDEEGQAELARGRGVEIWNAQALADRLVHHEIGVVGTTRGMPALDPGFWAELE